MKFKEIISRITGLNCPIFGINWNPSEPEVSVARRVVTFLEDRRVLYTPSEVEVPRHCVDSIFQIRDYLSKELPQITTQDGLAANLRALRAACRKFLTRIGDKDDEIIKFAGHDGHFASWIFEDALGQLRGVFGIHIAQLAVRYGLDVEDDLAQILPEKEEVDKAPIHPADGKRRSKSRG